MKYNYIYILLIFILFSCAQNREHVNNKTKAPLKVFSSKGFTLIYEDSFYKSKILNKKLNNEKLYILHSFLKPNTLVKIYNPDNDNFVTAKVKGISKYPSIYNSVISKKIAKEINLDSKDPYIELIQIKKNDKFIAKEASIFEEEKNVANKAPVDAIDINDLSDTNSSTEKNEKNKLKKKTPSYIIDIADFYYQESAEKVKTRFIKEANLSNIKVKKISNTKFKLFSGPYDSFESMKDIFFVLQNFGFDDLNVINLNK
tara:strand:+ start:63 stop:836 length:774 start_codon:yes stop_codon:yes gene_type:complete